MATGLNEDDRQAAALLLRAIAFAAQRHRDQRRKGSGASPYINHPIAVASILANDGGVADLTELVAAVLHDTIEDTGTSPEEIEENFGSDVRALVEELTDDKSLPKTERKRLQVAHASGLSYAAKRLKLADKIANVRDIIDEPPAGWSGQRVREYLDWAEGVIAGCRGASAALEALFDTTLREARTKEGSAAIGSQDD